MYIFTLPGGLKMATLVIGFILVNVGCDAVFNSDNYRSYIRGRDGATGFSKPDEFFKGVGDKWKEIRCNELKSSLEAHTKRKDSKEYKDAEEAYENSGCVVPPWVMEEMVFVFAAITCMVVSVICFMMSVFSLCDKCKSLKLVDGVMQVLLAVLIIIGSGCLLGAAVLKYNAGKRIIEDNILYDTKGKEKLVSQVERYQVRLYQKVAAGVMGFINAILYCVLGFVLCFKDEQK